MEHVQCRLYFCIAGADVTHDIISFQVAFEEGSMRLFDQVSLEIFTSSADELSVLYRVIRKRQFGINSQGKSST